jgi:hypothetical protein
VHRPIGQPPCAHYDMVEANAVAGVVATRHRRRLRNLQSCLTISGGGRTKHHQHHQQHHQQQQQQQQRLQPAAAAALRSHPRVLITDIKTYMTPYFMVKVETDQGTYGWGESGVGKARGLAVRGAVEHYREFLLGRDAMEIGALWQEMYRSQYFEGGRVLTGAQSAIDLALHDIVGKTLGVPCHQLLGGKHRDWIPCFPTCFLEMGPDAVADAQRLRKQGWQTIRFVGAGHGNRTEMSGNPEAYEPRESIAQTVKWLPRVRQAVDQEGPTTLILESVVTTNSMLLGVAVLSHCRGSVDSPLHVPCIRYHHRLSVAEAASLCQKLPPGTIDGLVNCVSTDSAHSSLITRFGAM